MMTVEAADSSRTSRGVGLAEENNEDCGEGQGAYGDEVEESVGILDVGDETGEDGAGDAACSGEEAEAALNGAEIAGAEEVGLEGGSDGDDATRPHTIEEGPRYCQEGGSGVDEKDEAYGLYDKADDYYEVLIDKVGEGSESEATDEAE